MRRQIIAILSLVLSQALFVALATGDQPNEKTNHEYSVAAYVWPSCHHDERFGDMLWPDGNGEWEVIKKGTPRFEGYYQPGPKQAVELPHKIGDTNATGATLLHRHPLHFYSAVYRAFQGSAKMDDMGQMRREDDDEEEKHDCVAGIGIHAHTDRFMQRYGERHDGG